MKILIVKTKLPITPEEAGAPRSFCLAQELSNLGHQIELVVFPTGEINPERVKNLETKNIFSKIQITRPPTDKSTYRSIWLHRLLNLTYKDLRIKQPQYLKEGQAFLEQYFTDNNFDIILSFGIDSVQFINPKLPSIIDLCDSLSLLSFRRLKSAIRTKESWMIFREALSYRSLEKKIARQYKNILFVSSVDRDCYVNLTGHINSNVIPLGIDSGYFSPSTREPQNDDILFTGVLDYEPNRDAIEYALDKIFPKIKEKLSSAKFLIVGKHTETELPANINQNGVELHTNVPDIRPYLQNSKIYLCPLRIGAGTKNKILSAMACKIPIVASAISIEGMGLIHDVHCLVGKNEEELINYSLLLLNDADLRARLVNSAYELALENSWKESARLLEEILKDAIRQSE